MLARSPEQRYANLHDVRDALAGLRAQVQEMPVEVTDTTIPMGSGGPSGTWRAPTPAKGGTTRILAGSTGTATPATSATGWPMRPASTAAQAVPAGNTGATAVTAMQAPPPDRGRSMRFIALGAAGVVVIGIASWLALRGPGGTPGPGANLAPVNPPAAGGAQTASTPPPAPANLPETPPLQPGGRAVADNPTGAATAGRTSGPNKTPADAGRGTARGTATPPAPPAGPVDLVVTWSQPFEITQGGKTLTDKARTRHDLKGVRPELGELYADSGPLRLHQRIATEKSGAFQVPEPGHLAVTMQDKFKACTVVVDSRDFATGNISPDRPKPIAAGRHIFVLRCGDKTEFTQTRDVASGVEPTMISFPPGGGG
jgi:hypothetical protein